MLHALCFPNSAIYNLKSKTLITPLLQYSIQNKKAVGLKISHGLKFLNCSFRLLLPIPVDCLQDRDQDYNY